MRKHISSYTIIFYLMLISVSLNLARNDLTPLNSFTWWSIILNMIAARFCGKLEESEKVEVGVDKYINANHLIKDINLSRANNNHNNAIASQTHNAEHRHFIKMVLDQSIVDVILRNEVTDDLWETRSCLVELYNKYRNKADERSLTEEMQMFYQGRAEAIWECINELDKLREKYK